MNIRLATPYDATHIRNIYRPIVLNTPISFEYDVPTVEVIEERIRYTLEQFAWLVCEEANITTGYAYAGTHRSRTAYQWSTEVSAYVHENYRGRKIGTALYKTLFELLKAQGYYRAFAGITLPNPASVRLHESVGFVPIGVFHGIGYKQDNWHDVGWWEYALQSTPPQPKSPIPFPKLEENIVRECLQIDHNILS